MSRWCPDGRCWIELEEAHVEDAWTYVRRVVEEARAALRGASEYHRSGWEALNRLVGGPNRDMPVGAAIEAATHMRDALRRDRLQWALEVVRCAATGEELEHGG